MSKLFNFLIFVFLQVLHYVVVKVGLVSVDQLVAIVLCEFWSVFLWRAAYDRGRFDQEVISDAKTAAKIRSAKEDAREMALAARGVDVARK